jgi:hypothetical protein
MFLKGALMRGKFSWDDAIWWTFIAGMVAMLVSMVMEGTSLDHLSGPLGLASIGIVLIALVMVLAPGFIGFVRDVWRCRTEAWAIVKEFLVTYKNTLLHPARDSEFPWVAGTIAAIGALGLFLTINDGYYIAAGVDIGLTIIAVLVAAVFSAVSSLRPTEAQLDERYATYMSAHEYYRLINIDLQRMAS